MMHDDLDTLLKQRYAVAKLTDAQLQRTLAEASRKPNRSLVRFAPWFAVATFLLVLLIPVARWVETPEKHSLAQLSADISKNHLAGNPADFYATDLNALAGHFKAAGMNIRLPDLLNTHGQITGARLCSLAGEPAIHVYFDADEHERKSLFIAKAHGALADTPTVATNNTALAVLTWAENGYFYALAKDSK